MKKHYRRLTFMSNLIIGVGHKARTGKDTVAEYLVEHYDFYRVGFADALKRGVQAIFGFTDQQVHGDKKLIKDSYWGKTPVKILQEVGTDVMRTHYDNDIWVKAAMKRVQDVQNEHPTGQHVVIPDVRFPNEVGAIKEAGGYLVRVDRPLEDRGDIGRDPNHPSEVALDDFRGWDFKIDNSYTLKTLYKNVDRVLISIYRREGITC